MSGRIIGCVLPRVFLTDEAKVTDFFLAFDAERNDNVS
jgi:hypothetical protein